MTEYTAVFGTSNVFIKIFQCALLQVMADIQRDQFSEDISSQLYREKHGAITLGLSDFQMGGLWSIIMFNKKK